jgi:hypothetical protein
MVAVGIGTVTYFTVTWRQWSGRDHFPYYAVPTACGLIEVAIAATEESQRLVRRRTGFFHVEPKSGAYGGASGTVA